MGLEHFVKGNIEATDLDLNKQVSLATKDTEVVNSVEKAKEAILETAEILGRLPTTGEYNRLREETGYSTSSSSFKADTGYTFTQIRHKVSEERPDLPSAKNSKGDDPGGYPDKADEEVKTEVHNYAQSKDNTRYLDTRQIAKKLGFTQYSVTYMLNSSDEFERWKSSNSYIFLNPYLSTGN